MTTDELFEAMKHGAVVFVNESTGESKIVAHDDLPPDMRECIRVARALKRIPYRPGEPGVYDTSTPEARAIMDEYHEHRDTCPDCIDADADNTLMDAAWWREEADHDPAPYPDGTRRTPKQCAAELEAEAAELRAKAAKIRADRMTEDEMKNAAKATEMEAASRQENGDEGIVQDLAEKLPSGSDGLTDKVVGVVCDLCGSHKAITVEEVMVRLSSPRACDCGANHSEVSFYYICETPCPDPRCLCHKSAV